MTESPVITEKLQQLQYKIGSLPMAFRLAGVFMLMLLLVLGILTVKVINTEETLLDNQIDAFGQTIVMQFSNSVTEPLFTDNQTSLVLLTRNLVESQKISYAQVLDARGNTLVEAGEQQLSGFNRDKSFFAEVSFQGVYGGRVVVNFTAAEVEESIAETLKTVTLLLLVMLVATLLMAMLISRRMARPVTELVRATERIGAGDYDINLERPYQDEVGQMATALSRMAVQLKQKQQLEGLFSRVVADDVAKTLMADMGSPTVATQRVDASVLFVDIVGFTSMSERHTPEEVVAMLNEYFSYFILCSNLFFGSVDKFIGDCAMIVFGVPKPNQDHRLNAIACAVAIQRLLQRFREELPEDSDQLDIRVKIGINSGEMMAGTVGAEDRIEYTVIGDAVNVASRLSDYAQADEILAGETTVEHPSMQTRIQAHPAMKLPVKGKEEPITAYLIDSVTPEQQRVIDTFVEDLLSHR